MFVRMLSVASRLNATSLHIIGTQPRVPPEHERLLGTPFIEVSIFRCHFDLGGVRHGWGLFVEQTDSLHVPLFLF